MTLPSRVVGALPPLESQPVYYAQQSVQPRGRRARLHRRCLAASVYGASAKARRLLVDVMHALDQAKYCCGSRESAEPFEIVTLKCV